MFWNMHVLSLVHGDFMFTVIYKTFQDYIYSSYYRLYNWCLHQAVDVISQIIKIKLCIAEYKYSDYLRTRIDENKHRAISCIPLIAETDRYSLELYKQSYLVNFGSNKARAETKQNNSETLWEKSCRLSTSKGWGNVLDEVVTWPALAPLRK